MVEPAAAVTDAARTPLARVPLARRPLRLAGAAAVVLVALALAAPLLAPYDPAEQLDAAAGRLRPPGTALAAVHLADGRWRLAERVARTREGLRVERLGRVETVPAGQVVNLTPDGVADRRVFLLGSDRFGRDVLSRLLHGARVSLAVGLLAVALATTLGIAIGAAAATGGRWLDALLMRTVDALLAFPWLFLLLALSALYRPGTLLLVLLLGGTGWMDVSRLVRAEIVGLARREFVLAARGVGQRPAAILWRHLLPAALPPVLVRGALLAGQVILVESALSFLGLGIQPPQASWGNMVSEGSDVLTRAWWLTAFPGVAIALTVISLNGLGDRLRDALDPRLRR